MRQTINAGCDGLPAPLNFWLMKSTWVKREKKDERYEA
jgi:hypothetical protein